MPATLGRTIALSLVLGMLSIGGHAADRPLVLERTIPLDGVEGRIDHLAVDLGRKRLFVAELGNDTVDTIDIDSGKVVKRLTGLGEPQGVAYLPGPDLVVVANGGDGSVWVFRGEDLAPAGSIALGDDADNVRVDPNTGRILVGYGDGALAIIDPLNRSRIGDVELAAHPESFQLDPQAGRAFVNLPDARRIAVIDLASRRQVASWTVPGLRSNFPMALDERATALAVVYRDPPRLVLLNPRSGAVIQSQETCGDADDVFFDTKRQQIYVSCGSGAVDVVRRDAAGLHPVDQIETSSGARTSLFVPELDRLFVAVRAGWFGSKASILVFRPAS
jgi:DNA-binding beta-propeller fold protein YncE